ncbi:MAG: sulfite exporter TauE/SafE family protein [Phycisphaerales bacterium]|nr:sulfite exporter TauE/SafE family protein [Phycisphaerales bacterium]
MSIIMLTIAIFALAVLYSAVGHAGASGYLAAMAIVTTMPQEEMKAVALTLNIFVGAIGSYHYIKAGHFDWRTFWPFAVCAVPLAFIGGMWTLPTLLFKPLIGCVLLYASLVLAVRGFKSRSGAATNQIVAPRMPPLPLALTSGAGLGLLAGLTGTGGGIFLSPLLLIKNWATPQRTAAISIVFVLVNSVAGLGGVVTDQPTLPGSLPYYIIAAIVGGFIGSRLGARRLPGNGIRLLLAIVLIIAAVKLFLAA